MSYKEHYNFGEKLAFHTAPTLLGIKCASLISMSPKEFALEQHSAIFNEKMQARGLKSRILCNCGRRTLLLVYNEKMLTERLSDPIISAMLRSFGYDMEKPLASQLGFLAERIRQNGDFPHEIGLFLDYPVEDVIGFIKNKGENFKLCGCWKVYGSEEAAKRTFANYDKCRRFLCNKLTQGADIYSALKIA